MGRRGWSMNSSISRENWITVRPGLRHTSLGWTGRCGSPRSVTIGLILGFSNSWRGYWKAHQKF